MQRVLTEDEARYQRYKITNDIGVHFIEIIIDDIDFTRFPIWGKCLISMLMIDKLSQLCRDEINKKYYDIIKKSVFCIPFKELNKYIRFYILRDDKKETFNKHNYPGKSVIVKHLNPCGV